MALVIVVGKIKHHYFWQNGYFVVMLLSLSLSLTLSLSLSLSLSLLLALDLSLTDLPKLHWYDDIFLLPFLCAASTVIHPSTCFS